MFQRLCKPQLFKIWYLQAWESYQIVFCSPTRWVPKTFWPACILRISCRHANDLHPDVNTESFRDPWSVFFFSFFHISFWNPLCWWRIHEVHRDPILCRFRRLFLWYPLCMRWFLLRRRLHRSNNLGANNIEGVRFRAILAKDMSSFPILIVHLNDGCDRVNAIRFLRLFFANVRACRFLSQHV